ncbi:MAG: sugar phosphate isomerase/epimerase [Pirellulales bacterium]|nr:sugar phosphate isomerase/epimerase [Pirellulales bacterium]
MFKNLSTQVLGTSASESEVIELSLSHGFRGLELDLVEFAARAKSGGLDKARRLFDSAKLKLAYFRLPVDLEADEATFRKQLTELIDLTPIAAQVGCLRAVTTISPGSDERPYHENFETHRKRLGEIGKLLAPHNIRLGVEFVTYAELRQAKSFEFIHGLEPLLMLLGMVGQPNVGVAIDLWHLHVGGTPLETLRKLKGEQIVTVALADVPADMPLDQCGENDRLLPGESGVVDTTAALVALAELGYDGPVTPAPSRSRINGNSRDAIVKAAGQHLDKVWKAAGLSPTGKLTATAR